MSYIIPNNVTLDNLTASSTISASFIYGNGQYLTNIPVAAGTIFTDGNITGDGTTGNRIRTTTNITASSFTASVGFSGSLLGTASYALDSNLFDGQDSTLFAKTADVSSSFGLKTDLTSSYARLASSNTFTQNNIFTTVTASQLSSNENIIGDMSIKPYNDIGYPIWHLAEYSGNPNPCLSIGPKTSGVLSRPINILSERLQVWSTASVGEALITAFLSKSSGLYNSAFFGVSDNRNGGFIQTEKDFSITAGGVERIKISGSGNIGIGTSSPTQKLDVSGIIRSTNGTNDITIGADGNGTFINSPGHASGEFFRFQVAGNDKIAMDFGGNFFPSNPNGVSLGNSVNYFNNVYSLTSSFREPTSDYSWHIMYANTSPYTRLEFRRINPTVPVVNNLHGYITAANANVQLNFTGQHKTGYVLPILDISQSIGMIVSSIGRYTNKDISINESLPVVDFSLSRNDKKVFGVISNIEDENNDTREYSNGNFVSVYEKAAGDNRIIINSLGEGAIWVTNINGNLENGDYITSCEIPGYGMKQDDDLLHNYTVAKITCDCNFDLDSKIYKCEELEFSGSVYRKAFVGCTYHCG